MSNEHDSRSLLIGTSLSPQSDEIAKVGIELARRYEAVPLLLHALEEPAALPPIATAADVVAQGEWRDRLKAKTREDLRQQAERTGVIAAGGRFELIPGDPSRGLVEWATTLGSLMIVIGGGEASRLWRLLGSTADRVVRRATCPVFVAHSGATFPPGKILAPVDLSQLSGGALRHGVELIRRLRVPSSSMDVVFVLHRAERAGSLHFSPEQVERFASEELERFVAAHGGEHHQELNRRLVLGLPRNGILEEVRREKPDLLVVGTQSRRGLDRLLLGSVATAVLYSAETSVLVVPPEAAAAALEPGQEGPDWRYISDDQPQARSA